jgi:uncharacterized DUF497 family protein
MYKYGINKEPVFEFDQAKSVSNQGKHGIDFLEAQAIWSDTYLLEQPVINHSEVRSVVTGDVAGQMWSAVITYRSGKVRIISVRRARKNEVALYEFQKEINRQRENNS